MPAPDDIEGSVPQHFKNIARFVKLMDSEFRIPGTHIRFGLDPIIGLIPGLGDLIDYGISAFLLIAMVRSGGSGKSVARMILNITIDGLIGLVPVIGRIFDVFYKANRRNLVLAIEHFEEGKHQGSAWTVILPILAILTLIFILFGVASFFLLKWILHFFAVAP